MPRCSARGDGEAVGRRRLGRAHAGADEQGDLARGLILGLAGCANVRVVQRTASEAELGTLNSTLMRREVTVGVSRREGTAVLTYDVERLQARALSLSPRTARWLDPGSRAERQVPLEALAWVSWAPPDRPRLVPALKLAGLGAADGRWWAP